MEQEFEVMALNKGWSQAKKVEKLLTYIENQQSPEAFFDFLQECPSEEMKSE